MPNLTFYGVICQNDETNNFSEIQMASVLDVDVTAKQTEKQDS